MIINKWFLNANDYLNSFLFAKKFLNFKIVAPFLWFVFVVAAAVVVEVATIIVINNIKVHHHTIEIFGIKIFEKKNLNIFRINILFMYYLFNLMLQLWVIVAAA